MDNYIKIAATEYASDIILDTLSGFYTAYLFTRKERVCGNILESTEFHTNEQRWLVEYLIGLQNSN